MTGFGGCILNPNGTLFDLERGYAEAFGTVLKTFDMDFDSSKVMDYADMSAEDLFNALNTGCTCKFRDFMISVAANLERCLIPSASLYDDAVPFLDNLKENDCPTGLFANLYGEQIYNLLPKFSMEDCFVSVIGIERMLLPRPNPIPLLSCAHELGTVPENILLISCSPKDIETGRNAGMKTVFMNRSGSAMDCGQEFSIRSLSEVDGLLFR